MIGLARHGIKAASDVVAPDANTADPIRESTMSASIVDGAARAVNPSPRRGNHRCSRSLNEFFRSKRFRALKKARWYFGDLLYCAYPTVPGCYVFIVKGRAVYVGSTNNLSTRMRAHRNR